MRKIFIVLFLIFFVFSCSNQEIEELRKEISEIKNKELNQEKCFKLSKDFRLKEAESIEEVFYSKKENWCYIVTILKWKDENWIDNLTKTLYNMLNYEYQASYSYYDIYERNYIKGFDKDLYIEIYNYKKN